MLALLLNKCWYRLFRTVRRDVGRDALTLERSMFLLQLITGAQFSLYDIGVYLRSVGPFGVILAIIFACAVN